jgi:hypothetical protein
LSDAVKVSNVDEAMASLKAAHDANPAARDASLGALLNLPAPPAPAPPPESTASALPKYRYGDFRHRLRAALPDCGWGFIGEK